MKQFANQLKHYRKRQGMSQKSLAKALGVGQTTIANYETGLRTPHTQLLTKLATVLGVSIDDLMGRMAHEENHLSGPETPDLERLEEELLHVLLKGDTNEVTRHLRHILDLHLPLSSLYEEVLAPCLFKVGDLWESGQIDVFTEHYISYTAETFIGHLMQSRPSHMGSTGKFMGLAIEGEMHVIGIKMLSHLMTDRGWQTYFLGNNLSNGLALKALVHQIPDVVGISCTSTGHLAKVRDLIEAIKREEVLRGTKIIVGGQAFCGENDLWKSLGADAYGSDLNQSVSKIEALINRNEVNHE
ncbi:MULTISPECIES: helix-turn-helix domain-containing protein [unclassified Fusibacter]|uniref:helix-turn-helix domain-containing protein n=1 Tax=unclassified Fusibacter TaxID=2624464 RepID=UPI0010134F3C|nr:MULTISPECIES: helix-turn-helix domain-containing protein [unclassified Fusibacter]MCK8061202.1 helix-turn-helix domain-containing protein [Fusibacter sp. A2]NPE23454.1 helix-turn-helix domain-containing protein [Fusibacter sp. A1]RXV59232.1 helix-turn-helix domain-containing protein [Fusibacter sp. A1]